MKKVIVVGGGASGMIAAIMAARNGAQVILVEKNDKLGKKIYITGKGRCNITNSSDTTDLFKHVISNPKFLYSAFNTFSNEQTIKFFNELGLKTKIERGNRVFPLSDKSSDVTKVLELELKRLNVTIFFNSEVDKIIIQNNKFTSVQLKNNNIINGNAVIIATGGLSYKSTGSTGDGYKFAQYMGHTIIPTNPSLVPFNIKEDWVKSLQGLSLKNVELKILNNNKVIYKEFGEMLFTHFGISGPIVLSASRYIIPLIKKTNNIIVNIDLKPALDNNLLDNRVKRDFEKNVNKQFKNSLDELLPKKLIPIIINLSGISGDKKVNEITKKERITLVNLLKNLQCSIEGLRDYNEAIITCGGVNIKEINPKTMESKIVSNVFFAGEVLDVDALTGGYNLQIAWSTGYVAGNNI